MKPLPEKGLIVSCYLESMQGCEKQFIASVANLPEVVALRVEGLDNIRFARMIAPEKFIIGLVKNNEGYHTSITMDLHSAYAIVKAGADMVATDCLTSWGLSYSDYTLNLVFLVMYDVPEYDVRGMDNLIKYKQCIFSGGIVIATTHFPKAFDMVIELREKYPKAKINLEGGIETGEEIKTGFACGADWVTIGKAINDPPSIIRSLLSHG